MPSLPHPLFGFSSMGCHDASFDALLQLGRELGADYVELRGVAGSFDLPAVLAAHPAAQGPSAPPVRVVTTNLHLAEATEADIAAFLPFAALADRLQAPYVRVFASRADHGQPVTRAMMEQAARNLAACRAAMRAAGCRCEMLQETHSAFSSSRLTMEFNALLEEPLAVLWDSHHTWAFAGETPAESWENFGPLVRHIHFNDSRPQPALGQGREYVIPGQGLYPIAALRELLARVGYAQGVTLEWTKLYFPQLPELRAAFPRFLELMKV